MPNNTNTEEADILASVPDRALLEEVRRRGLGRPNNAPPVRRDWRLTRPEGHPDAVPVAIDTGGEWYLAWETPDGDELPDDLTPPDWPFNDDALARGSDFESLGFWVV